MDNVLFTENVAEFYQMRQLYKTSICDSVAHEIDQQAPFASLKGTLDFDYSLYAIMSSGVLNPMRQLFAQSKQMMEVTDKEIEAYRKERAQIDQGMAEEDEAADSVINEIMQLQGEIDEAKAKLELE